MTPAVPWWHGLASRWLPVACLLALAVAALHGNALHTGFKYDDPAHLRFAAAYAPWQYFLQRDVLLEQSYAHITPILALAFDLGLAVAGFDVRGHVLLLLVVLWAASLATWALLRRWLSAPMALGAALLFLAMPATGAVAHMLMTVHYAWGLLFAVLALMAHARAVDRRSLAAAWLAALFYALACLSKELYVPLVLVMLAWPGLPWRQRLRLAAPAVAVALGYVVLRWWVLGGIGGYAELTLLPAPPTTAEDLLRRVLGLLRDGVGPGLAGALAALLAAFLLIHRGRRLAPIVTLAAAIVLLVPVAPLLRLDLPYGLSRALLFAGWAVAVALAFRLDGRRHALAWMLVLAALLIPGQQSTTQQVEAMQQAVAAQTAFLLAGRPDQTLVVHEGRAAGYLRSLQRSVLLHEGRRTPGLAIDEDDFAALGPDRGAAAMAWRSDCVCVQPLGDAYRARLESLEAALARGRGLPLGVAIALRPVGHLRLFEWSLDGPAGAVSVEIRGEGRVDLPPRGARAFGIDTTFDPGEPSALRFTVRTPDGAQVRTPWLTLSVARSNRVEWSGAAP